MTGDETVVRKLQDWLWIEESTPTAAESNLVRSSSSLAARKQPEACLGVPEASAMPSSVDLCADVRALDGIRLEHYEPFGELADDATAMAESSSTGGTLPFTLHARILTYPPDLAEFAAFSWLIRHPLANGGGQWRSRFACQRCFPAENRRANDSYRARLPLDRGAETRARLPLDRGANTYHEKQQAPVGVLMDPEQCRRVRTPKLGHAR